MKSNQKVISKQSPIQMKDLDDESFKMTTFRSKDLKENFPEEEEDNHRSAVRDSYSPVKNSP